MYYKHVFDHVEQRANNRIMPYIGTQGQPSVYMRTQFMSQDIGQLFDYVTYVMDVAKRPLISYQNFTLVNAYARFWHFSRGFCPPPQDEAICSTAGLVLTFALSQTSYNEYSKWNTKFKVRYPLWSYAWGFRFNVEQFFTISIPFSKLKDCKMQPLLPRNLWYVYNLMSSLSKCWILRRDDNNVSDNLWNVYNNIYRLPFPDLLNRYSVKSLPYNRWVWQNATNLISTSIDYNVALFYFLYINTDDSDVGIMSRTEGDLLYSVIFGDTNSLKSLLIDSIVAYKNDRGKEDLLLVASLYGKYSYGPNYNEELKKIHYSSNLKLDASDAIRIIKGMITDESLEAI